ncbi:MAG: hypothetical protein H0T46_01035 [Deltaproteobacteria bacterium]|nr:hypothetical protein [Deltaproteobacteria bacterium]
MKWLAIVLALVACKSKRDADHQTSLPVEPVIPRDAGPDAASSWTAALDKLPLIAAERTIILPSRADQPRFDVVGPLVVGDLAIVGSSQLGFAAVDWRRGVIVWTKPSGSRIAPPAVQGEDILLIGDCTGTPPISASDALLGCLRSVTADGADDAHIAIRGKAAAVESFSHSVGEQHVWVEGERVRWRRGDQAVSIDLGSGVAVPAPVASPPLSITYKERHWDIEQVDGKIIARGKAKQDSWESDRSAGELLGPVWIPQQSPMLRFVSISGRYGAPELRLHDMNATGSLFSQISLDSVPGIAMLAHAMSPVGDVAMAVRLDKTLKHDFIAGFSANALLRWVYPLPETARTDRVGIAIALDAQRAPEAVVVFHDGDTVTILPELSSPPTAPGAARGPLENATP